MKVSSFSTAFVCLAYSTIVAVGVVEAWVVPSSSSSTSAMKRGSTSLKHMLLGDDNDNDNDSSSSSSSSSSFCTTTTTTTTTIIGGGRIGNMLQKGDGESIVLKRGESIPADGTGPILIATRNDSLDSIVDDCPMNRREDLVFLQNGYLEDFLRDKKLLYNNCNTTRVLLYLSVSSMDATPVDGITSANPEGLTAVNRSGKHAILFQERLASLNMKCHILNDDTATTGTGTADDYKPAMFEKLIWICVYMLVGAAKQTESVGEAQALYGTTLIAQLITELVSAVQMTEDDIQFQPGTVERLAAYTDVVYDFPAAVKEFEWRNRYFYNLGDDKCPIHNQLLRDCADKGLLSFELP